MEFEKRLGFGFILGLRGGGCGFLSFKLGINFFLDEFFGVELSGELDFGWDL